VSKGPENSPWHDLAAGLVMRAQESGKPTCYLVTSAGAGEGRSTVARGVAAMAAEMGKKAGVIEIASAGSPDGTSLAGAAAPGEFPVASNGFTRWTLPPTFASLPAVSRDPHDWVTGFDLMLIDGPPIGAFLQQFLAPVCDGVIIVADTGKRRRAEVARAARTIAADGGKLIGVVLNRHKSPLPRWLDKWGDRP